MLCTCRYFITESPVESEEDEEPKVVLNSPEFFNSLSQAHPTLNTSLDDTESKENNIHSTKNMFAQKSPSKKQRFNLNAAKPKEVKSRFVA